MDINRLTLQFITDEKGKKKAVILQFEEFLELLEDYEDIAQLAERRDERTIPFEQVLTELKRDGFLQD